MGMGAMLTPAGQPVSNLAERDRPWALANLFMDPNVFTDVPRRDGGLSFGDKVDGAGRPAKTLELA
jgi:hypothetical protein